MKKKIEQLIEADGLAQHAEFKSLHAAHHSAKGMAKQAKATKATAKEVYRAALAGQCKAPSEQLIESLAAFRKAKCMQEYQRIEVRLAKHRLQYWIEQWLQKSEVPHEPKRKKITAKDSSLKKKDRSTLPKPKTEAMPATSTSGAKAAAPKKKKGQ